MSSRARIWIFIAFCSIANLERCYSYVDDRAKIVTYGEPCVEPRQLPIKIEGPMPPTEEVKVPVSLDFRVISDMYVQPPRPAEYPIAIQVPCATESLSKLIATEDPLRGKSYAYNSYVPPAANPLPLPKNYDFAVDIPVATKQIACERSEEAVPRLKGLVPRVDRILVPACQQSSSCPCSVN
ncbi:uncharacterized protein LOC143372865 [Andrena cerasifolii]|uniref:uncharacterized protein LOC143372865 n=1 Tax=Andrena cerasifolii TaxID=2819439 RepID=UPI004037A05D